MEGRPRTEQPEAHERESSSRIATIELLGKRAEQQDAHAWKEAEHNGVKRFVLAVADGHGPRGEKASKFAAEKIVNDLAAEEKIDAPLIAQQFSLLHDAISQAAMNSGTTLTVAIKEGRKLTTAYVGDSEARLFVDGKLRTRTIPHNLHEHEGEKERISRSPARVENNALIVSMPGGWSSPADDKDLHITRSLGDILYEPYKKHEPQVETITLSGTEKFLLVGSDGFWSAAFGKQKRRHAIEHVLATTESADEVREKILSMLSRGELNDNVTLIIAELK